MTFHVFGFKRLRSLFLTEVSNRLPGARSFGMSALALSGAEPRVFVFDEEPLLLPPEQGHGYIPLRLEQVLCTKNKKGKANGPDNYEIVRKLGWAAHASVWLGRACGQIGIDYQEDEKYAAIKVLTSNYTAAMVNNRCNEIGEWQTVTNTSPDHPGHQYCLRLRFHFLERNHHGLHSCLVSSVAGMNLEQLQHMQPGQVFSVALTKRIVRQVLLALDLVHRDCKLIHTDVKPANILLSVIDANRVIDELLRSSPAREYPPKSCPGMSLDPLITVESQPLTWVPANDDELSVILADFGDTTPISHHYLEEDVQPTILRAPEILIGHSWSTPIDIWALGCSVNCLLSDNPSSTPTPHQRHPFRKTNLKIVELIGPIPPAFVRESTHAEIYFDSKGLLFRVHPALSFAGLEDYLEAQGVLRAGDIVPAAALIRRCLTIDPAHRPTAEELLKDEWLLAD